MKSEPKFINVSIQVGTRNLFLVAVKTNHIPGALGDVATRLGKANINILTTADCSSFDNPESTLSFFVDAQDPGTTDVDIEKVLRSSPYFLDCHIRKGDPGLFVDDFAFPVMFYPGGRGIILPQSGVKAMFREMVKLFGTGGESILYHAGMAMGRSGFADLANLFKEEGMIERAAELAKFYSALGWGRLHVIDITDDSARLKLADGFESEGVKASKPSCHFTRGMIAGSGQKIFGVPVECKEDECVSAGSPHCIFTVSAKALET